MDGLWNRANERAEEIKQARFNRMRILTVSTSPPPSPNNFDASMRHADDPNTITDENGGPDFIMSPRTPDESPHSYGFESCLLEADASVVAGQRLVIPAGGVTVTIWRLITTTMLDGGVSTPKWASFAPVTGVQYNELYHSFDTNTIALRFQVTGQTQEGTFHIGFAEL